MGWLVLYVALAWVAFDVLVLLFLELAYIVRTRRQRRKA